MQKIITGDETWCFQYNFDSKWQSLQWKQLTFLQPKEAYVKITKEDNIHNFL
jgi:hypothetical protein